MSIALFSEYVNNILIIRIAAGSSSTLVALAVGSVDLDPVAVLKAMPPDCDLDCDPGVDPAINAIGRVAGRQRSARVEIIMFASVCGRPLRN
jgi:hypothetical protein